MALRSLLWYAAIIAMGFVIVIAVLNPQPLTIGLVAVALIAALIVRHP